MMGPGTELVAVAISSACRGYFASAFGTAASVVILM